MTWANDLTKAKITKAALALTNIRDGGWIVIGVEQDNDTFTRTGLIDDIAETYTHDNISSHVNNYADPFVNLHVFNNVVCEDKRYVVVQIDEFEELPVICRREYPRAELHQGKIYSRTRRRNENSEALTSTEMREIIDLAVEKSTRRFFEKLKRVGAFSMKPVTSEEKVFEKQLEDIE